MSMICVERKLVFSHHQALNSMEQEANIDFVNGLLTPVLTKARQTLTRTQPMKGNTKQSQGSQLQAELPVIV